jgi:hypothetical protein
VTAIPERRRQVRQRQQRGWKCRFVPRNRANAAARGGRANGHRLRQQRAREFEEMGVAGAQPIGQAGARKVGKDGK